jgi:hypothetical protein
VGNPANGNTVVMGSGAQDQLSIAGGIQISNTTSATTETVDMSCSLGDGILSVNGDLALTNSNSKTIILSSNTTNNNQLNINGSCIITNGTNGTLLAQSNGNLEITTSTTGKGILLKDPSTNNSILSVDTNGFVLSSGMTIGNTSNSNYSILSSDTTTNQVLNITGSATISSVQSYGTTYPDQNLATIKYVNGLASTGVATLTAGTSTSPQIFTGYNQINNLRFNGMSCPQAIINLVNQYQVGLGSQWIWTTGIPYTLGNGFAFAFSTNNTPTPYTVASQEVIVPQANGVISGTGYALLQPYTYNSVNYNAYVLSITGYSGTASLSARTVANNMGTGSPYYAIQTDDSNNYYALNNIKMTLYIYPQGIV